MPFYETNMEEKIWRERERERERPVAIRRTNEKKNVAIGDFKG